MRFTLLLLGGMLLTSTLLHGQLTKSTWFITGDIYSTGGAFFENNAGIESNLGSLEINYLDNSSIFSFNVSPSIGYFVSDRWLLGTGMSFLASSFRNNFWGDSNEFLLLSPFARYYFNPQTTNFHYFAEGTYNQLFAFRDSDFNTSNASIFGGVTYRINEYIALDGKLGYSVQNLTNEDVRRGNIQGSATLNILLSDGLKRQENTGGILQKGTLLTGVNDLSFGGMKRDNWFDRFFNIRPKLLYFFTDRWAIGMGLEYSWERLRFRTSDANGPLVAKVNYGTLSFTPQTRYYFLSSSRSALFAAAGVEIRREVINADDATARIFNQDKKTVTNSNNITLGVGANIFVNRNLAFEFGPSLRYSGEDKVTRFGIDAGLQLFFGGKE